MSKLIGTGWAFPLSVGSQGGLALATDKNEIEQAIVIILATSIGERVMRPRFGSRLSELLFEPCNRQTLALAEQYVKDALAMWEPRINVNNVIAALDSNMLGAIYIDVQYTVKTTSDSRSLVYPLYTIPERELNSG